jgi:LysM repeat protein
MLTYDGENPYRIAMKYGLTVDKLRDINKMTPSQSIYPGQKLLVSAAEDS